MSLKVGVIGCGMIGGFHFDGLEKAGADVRWVCDLNADAARGWCEKFGARYTADWKEIVADDEVDVVEVLTISSTHKEMCLAAIDAGKAVICEKTLAENPDDSLQIVQAARDAGTIFYTSYMKRFIPAVARAKELMGELGTILSTHIRAYQPWGLPWDEVGPEFEYQHAADGESSVIAQKYGGGILVCGGSHILDLTGFFLGRPKRLYAAMHTPAGTDLDLQAAAIMETDNGVVHYEALGHPLERIGFLRDGWDERVEINGTQGRLEIYSALWDDPFHKSSLLVHYDSRTHRSTEYRYPPVSPFAQAVAFFLDNIARGRQGDQPITTGYDVDELIATIKASAERREALDVNYRI